MYDSNSSINSDHSKTPFEIIYFNFHGLKVILKSYLSEASLALERTKKEHTKFLSEPSPVTDLTWTILPSYQATKTRGLKLFRNSMCQSYGFKKRTCVYNKTHQLRIDSSKEINIFGSDPELIYEILTVSLNSFVGWELEKMGLIRLHAAGFEVQGKSYALLLPARGGKSSLSFELLQSPEVKILAEETCFIDNFCLRHWSGFISLRSLPSIDHIVYRRLTYPLKYLVSIPENKITMEQNLTQLLWGTQRQSILWPLSFATSVFLGLGLQQIREYQLRWGNFSSIFFILKQRALFILRCFTEQKVKSIIYNYQLKPWTKRFEQIKLVE